MIEKKQNIFTRGSARSIAVKRNIGYAILLKCVSIGISLLVVPLTLGYLAEEEYGIWLTLSSMLAWIGFFDIGLTNGLRNKLTEALVVNDKERARIYVSTTFILLIGIIIFVLLIFICGYKLINWCSVFNTSTLSSQALGQIVLITVVFFGLQFILKTVTTVYFAAQRAAIVDAINTLGSFFSLGIIYLLTQINPSGSLLCAAITFLAPPASVYAAVYFITFYGKYRYLLPSIKKINLKYTKDLIGLGFNFFIIQFVALVLFTTSNFIITQLFGPAEVTIYNIAYKYFSIAAMGFTIILTPLWNAYTDAYVQGDFGWIRSVLRKLMFVWGICVICTAVMVIASPWVYRIWVGEKVASSVPLSVSIACAVYISITNWNSITSYLLNGVGKVQLQLYNSLIALLVFIPLALYLSKIFGVSGIVYAICGALLIGSILQPIQSYKIINQHAKGIWNK
ncbi:MAG: oligosaccharide flippase family protein [Prevotellaceae bacterium]|jgi:O-antigen/teichoic acid export membrane protein|nr:oligosaccharide flippase family protein [Prevotellaceae bacterium]